MSSIEPTSSYPLRPVTPSLMHSERFDFPLVAQNLTLRDGNVIRSGTLIKPDFRLQLPNAHAYHLGALSGCPAFRLVFSDDSIYALGQPSVSGVKCLIQFLRNPSSFSESMLTSSAGFKSIHWINLREEPVVYINRKPMVLREEAQAFANVAFSQLSLHSIESIEEDMRTDILRQAAANNGLFLIHREFSGRMLVPTWELVDDDLVMTSQGLYRSLDGHSDQDLRLTYHRVPCSSEHNINSSSYDSIDRIVSQIPVDAPLVFNDQSGASRATVGAIISRLVRIHMRYTNEEALQRIAALPDEPPSEEAGLPSVIALTSLLDYGAPALRLLNHLISEASLVVDLRKNILEQWRASCAATSSADAQRHVSQAKRSLLKYLHLLVFSSFLFHRKGLADPPSFESWTQTRREFLSMRDSVLHQEGPAVFRQTCPRSAELSFRTGALLSQTRVLMPDALNPLSLSSLSSSSVQPLAMFDLLTPSWQLAGIHMPDLSLVADIYQRLLSGAAPSHVVWINLREDPVVFIQREPFSLRYYDAPLQDIDIYRGIAPDAIEELEARLCGEILGEARAFKQKLLLHHLTEAARLDSYWMDVPSTSLIQTNQTAFTSLFQQHLGDQAALSRLSYFRIPLTPQEPPELQDIDQLLHILSNIPDDLPVSILCYSHLGADRTTTLMVLVALFDLDRNRRTRRSSLPSKSALRRSTQASPQDPRAALTQSGVHHRLTRRDVGDFLIIRDLLRLLPAAATINYQLDKLIEQFSTTYHLKNCILQTFEASLHPSSREESEILRARTISFLKRYILLVLFSAFLNDTRSQPVRSTFSAWLSSHPELENILSQLDTKPDSALRIAPLTASGDISAFLRLRAGNVLNADSILKADHFPGAQRPGFEQLEGVPNFRIVEGYRIAGFAIPTIDGIRNVLHRLNADPQGSGKVVWSCLREEPVLFVNSSPYVVRNLQRPYENLSYTGISASDVESVEARLKVDVLREIDASTESRMLLHGEMLDADNKYVLHGEFEVTPKENVFTPQEVFELLQSEGWHVDYVRLPITDEQHPEANDFDDLVKAAQPLLTEPMTYCVFHCQMGRGRTTTGMIVANLLAMLSSEHHHLVSARHHASESSSTSTDAQASNPYLDGNYALINRLVRVIKQGPIIKSRVDIAIDRCSRMQNLREDIYPSFQRARDHTLSEKDRNHAKEVAQAYLIRYFYLIVFAAYLDAVGISIPFSAWLKEHSEITALERGLNIDEQ